MDSKRPVFLIDARDRIVTAYRDKARRREFDLIVGTCDYDYDRAWEIFAERLCPTLPRSYILDAADLARTALWADKGAARWAERVGA